MADNGDIDDKVLAGTWYADTFHVGFNALQFKVDCGHDPEPRDGEEDEMIKVYFRIIASPLYARQLFTLLGSVLLQYSDTYGPIAAGPRAGRREP